MAIENESTDGTENDSIEAELEQQAEADRKKNEMLQRKIDDAKVEGWKVSEEQGDRAVMTKPNYGSLGGHTLIALLTVWWTVGLGNVCYAAWKYFTGSDKRVLRVD